MEPRIQYAKTADGVSIAFGTLGKGPALVHVMAVESQMQAQWEAPEFRRWDERLAEKRMVVKYDSRGTGLSQRDVTDFSPEALMVDLEAVIDRLGLERFALWGTGNRGPLAIAYAARHPERVSHLILWHCYSGSHLRQSPQVQALRRLQDNWELFTDTLAHYAFGWPGGEAARLYAARMRENMTHETYRALLTQVRTLDVTELLPQVRAPTLVLHRRQYPLVSVDVATDLASRIPNARLVLLEGQSGGYPLEDGQAVREAIDEFLGEGEEAAAKAPKLATEDVHTILFTDVEGSTALTQRLGDAKARELLRDHERIVREALKAHGGSEVKTLGDGFMTSFSSATKALECAIAMQRAFAEHNDSAEEPIKVRIGLNAGEPIAEDDDLFGTAVNLAARITAKAEGGEILTSDTVRGLVAGKKFLFSDRGETAMRGFEDPVKLYELSWRETS
jgi:class 3 adenylate cyclase